MSGYTVVNIKDVEDMAASHGLSPNMESRFARTNLEMEQGGVGYFRYAPNFRAPFGHTHEDQEEVYVVVNGSARIKLDDDIEELAQWDMVRVPAGVMRCIEGGPEGAEILAFGAPNTENRDAEMVPGWWSD